jgi:hypothetical protein
MERRGVAVLGPERGRLTRLRWLLIVLSLAATPTRLPHRRSLPFEIVTARKRQVDLNGRSGLVAAGNSPL